MLADTTVTLRLFASGLIPGWLGLLLFVAASVFVLTQLRRDLAGTKPTRLTRRVLPLIRLTIVAMFAWLLCQPVLLIARRWISPPEVLLVVDSGNSMRVNEGAGDVSRELDALDAVEKQPLAKRTNAASRIAQACANVSRATIASLASLKVDQDAVMTGLPLGPSVARKIDELVAQLRQHSDALASARAQLPPDLGDKELKKSVAELAATSQVISVAMEGIVADGPVVAREAGKSPDLLDAYAARLKKLLTDTDSTQKRAIDVQQKLDGAVLTEKDIQQVRARPLTRQSLADMAAERLEAHASLAHSTSSGQAHSMGPGAEQSVGVLWTHQRSPSLITTLDDAFRRTLASPLAAVVLLSDGASPLPPAGGTARESLARLHIPVNTILIGADGQEPADAGLIAVDVPRIALAGDPVIVRCLVKNLITTTPPPKLTLSIGKQKIATRDLAVSKDAADVIELSWTPATPGRMQLVFGIESALGDAFPGNESSAAIVDVIANKAHVLIVSDRLTGDFAAISQILATMPAVDSHAIVAAPGLSKFRTGSKSDEFPATVDDFKALSVVVLIGDVPEAVGPEVIQSLKQAVDAGLRVWVQAPAAGRSGKSWASALGIETRSISGRQPIKPPHDLWLSLYELGRETDESAERWRELPALGDLSEIVSPGISLLTADGRSVMELVPRKAGAVIVSGISDFAALRTPSSGASVNRLLAESLALTLAPIGEPGMTQGMFPPQPVLEHDVFLVGNTTNGKGLIAAEGVRSPDGVKAFHVGDSPTIGMTAGGSSIERVARHLVSRQDFQLAAHDAPLEKIATETGGRHRDLLSMMDVLPPGLTGTPRSSATRVPLWPGAWSLIVILALVSAEYLLRRRAGKVM